MFARSETINQYIISTNASANEYIKIKTKLNIICTINIDDLKKLDYVYMCNNIYIIIRDNLYIYDVINNSYHKLKYNVYDYTYHYDYTYNKRSYLENKVINQVIDSIVDEFKLIYRIERLGN